MSERKDMNLTPEELRLQEAVRGLGDVRPDDAFAERLRQQFMSGAIDTATGSTEAPDSGDAGAGKVVPFHVGGNRRRLLVASIPLLAALLAFLLLGGGDPSWSLKSVQGTGIIQVDGKPVDATGAKFENGTLDDLVVNARVEVEGTFQDGVLVAVKVKFEGDGD